MIGSYYLGRKDFKSMDTYTVFAMNSNDEIVGGSGHRVGRAELVQLIDKLLDSDRLDDDGNDESKIITYVEVHDGSCSVQP
jgi:hypothetical protein